MSFTKISFSGPEVVQWLGYRSSMWATQVISWYYMVPWVSADVSLNISGMGHHWSGQGIPSTSRPKHHHHHILLPSTESLVGLWTFWALLDGSWTTNNILFPKRKKKTNKIGMWLPWVLDLAVARSIFCIFLQHRKWPSFLSQQTGVPHLYSHEGEERVRWAASSTISRPYVRAHMFIFFSFIPLNKNT